MSSMAPHREEEESSSSAALHNLKYGGFFLPQSRGTFLEQGIHVHIIFSFKHGSFLMNLSVFRAAWPAT